eukprot:CAMPEP_0119308526 /NCGR_PEP_ID=MMETSP1333-20130426/11517_1 /TAXON_ID=418940 /ORGANISM="Scyphosphaera apsteinii, Strain RCC1455" /LENGTH=67 /DNA_ID=CAMNT_0007312323 /DNA_START=583 /DNA_END=786 /DNA_ORIENTATION=-
MAKDVQVGLKSRHPPTERQTADRLQQVRIPEESLFRAQLNTGDEMGEAYQQPCVRIMQFLPPPDALE